MPVATDAADRWVPLAVVARPHGVGGELRLRPYNRDSDLLLTVAEVVIRSDGADDRVFDVESARRANDAVLMALADVRDRDQAELLRGATVCARRSAFPPLEPGEFYVCDLEGARVFVERGPAEPGEDPREVGRVLRVQTYPSAEVLVVHAADGGRPWEVPLVGDVVREVDVERGVVTLATMDGVERG